LAGRRPNQPVLLAPFSRSGPIPTALLPAATQPGPGALFLSENPAPASPAGDPQPLPPSLFRGMGRRRRFIPIRHFDPAPALSPGIRPRPHPTQWWQPLTTPSGRRSPRSSGTFAGPASPFSYFPAYLGSTKRPLNSASQPGETIRCDAPVAAPTTPG